MNQVKSIIGRLEKQVANPEVQVSVNVSSFVISGRHKVETKSKGKIYQNVSNTWTIPEKVPVVTIVLVMIVYEYDRVKIEAANYVGKLVGERALDKGIKEVVFDRNGFLYHGRVKSLSEGARKAGLIF